MSNLIISTNNEWWLFHRNAVNSDRIFDILFTYPWSNLDMFFFLGEQITYLMQCNYHSLS